MERLLSENDFIVSKTDLQGRITYANRIFLELAEYDLSEILGQPHSIVRHPEMPGSVFRLLWDRIIRQEEIFAYVMNKTKNGHFYWVYANVTASLDEAGTSLGYYSVRRRPNPKALEIVKPLYRTMVEAERRGGIVAGEAILREHLQKGGMDYDEYIIGLQG